MGSRVKFRGAKVTPKTMEKGLLERSKALAEDPSILMPRCTKDCKRCRLRILVGRMKKVSEQRQDPKKLSHNMNWGDPFVRAYAATISLSIDGKVPYLLNTKTPIGEVSYAARGKTEKDKLIGIQHYDHPQLRLMALWRTAERYGLHMYSTEKEVICAPDGPSPPAEYVQEVIAMLPYELDSDRCCPHKNTDEALKVKWKSVGIELRICSECAKDVNTMHILSSRIAAKDPIDDFEISADTGFKCMSECQKCNVKNVSGLSKELISRYMKGETTDADILREHENQRRSAVREGNDEIYMIGDSCFGTDKENFILALRGNEVEKEAIAKLIRSKKLCILASNDQVSNIISELWPEHSNELLAQVASPAVVSALLEEHTQLTPAQMVLEAKRMEGSKNIEASLPKYRKLGPVGEHADRIARAYKTEGKDSALRVISATKDADHKLRSVSFAFLEALGENRSSSWQFSKEEMDFGNYLSAFAKSIMDGSGDEYDKALKLIVQAAGAIEETVKK